MFSSLVARPVDKIKIVRWMVMNSRPFNLIEDEGLGEAFNVEETLPSRRNLNRALDEIYLDTVEELKKDLKEAESGISFSTVLWRDKYERSGYQVVTAH